jgi:hypothetical protein
VLMAVASALAKAWAVEPPDAMALRCAQRGKTAALHEATPGLAQKHPAKQSSTHLATDCAAALALPWDWASARGCV